MKTQIRKEGSKAIISLEGKLSFETSEWFREYLFDIEKTVAEQIIFDFTGLEFVGSSGISTFIHLLKEFNLRASSKPKYSNVGTEFRRMIKTYDDQSSFDFFESMERPIISFDN